MEKAYLRNDRHKYSESERLMVKFLWSNLTTDKDGNLNFTYVYDFDEVCKYCELKARNKKELETALLKTIKDVSDKTLWIVTEEKITSTRWIEKANFYKNGKVEFILDKQILPFMYENSKKPYDFSYSLSMRSIYSVRFYDYFMLNYADKLDNMWGFYELNISFKDLTEVLFHDLEVKGELKKYINVFANVILNTIEREVNYYSDIFIEFNLGNKDKGLDAIINVGVRTKEVMKNEAK